MLESETLLLRPITDTDNTAVFAYRSDAATNQYQGFIPKSLDEVDAFIARNPTEWDTPNTWFQLVILERETNTLVGDVGVHFIGKAGQQCEIGCTINKNYQGQGYAPHAMKLIINHLFGALNKQRIIASVDPRNTPSLRLLERLGFRKEAHFKKSLYLNGQWVDDMVYALLQDDWNI